MKNKLADVLNDDMLNLIQQYQNTLGEKGTDLNSTIDLLNHTSILVKVCRDKRPICKSEDNRLVITGPIVESFSLL